MTKSKKVTIRNFKDAEHDSDFSSGDCLLDAIREAGVFSVEKVEGGFDVTDACDNWYGCFLTADDMRALASELIALADGAKDG